MSDSRSRKDPKPPPVSFASWDKRQSYHASTERAVKPLLEKFYGKPTATTGSGLKAPAKSGPGTRASVAAPISVDQAVQHMEKKGRFFTHEMQSEYVGHAIGQGGVQSGYDTSKQLGLPEPKRDKGTAAAAFVFTRQIPSSRKITTKLSEGQVGAGVDAMLVFKPSIFADPEQPAFFKTIDGAHHSDSIMSTKARKGAHMKQLSDAIATSSDKILHANQEQGIHGAASLRHLEAIVLKAPEGKLDAKKEKFISSLHSTFRDDVLPPIEDRRKIKAKTLNGKAPSPELVAEKYKAFQQRVFGQSLYDHLENQINADTKPGAKRRQVTDLIVPLSHNTRRVDVPTHMPKRPDNVPLHERTTVDGKKTRLATSLGKPNEAFFKPRS